MYASRLTHTVAFSAVLCISSVGALAQSPLSNYRPVTDNRLINPEEQNWLSYRGTLDGWGYSPLDQIDTGNVAELQPVWTFSTGVTGGHESPPIVNDGVMFVTTPGNLVYALDAVTGDMLWRYQHDLPSDLIAPHRTNRGVALYDDKVYTATLDARVVALDSRTGEKLWDTSVQDNSFGYYITMAPLAIDGKIMVGSSGGERGVRGFVVALDAETGEELWRTYTVPGPGEPGNET
jgi:alcohol dehydrogenase (cytochrome c)